MFQNLGHGFGCPCYHTELHKELFDYKTALDNFVAEYAPEPLPKRFTFLIHKMLKASNFKQQCNNFPHHKTFFQRIHTQPIIRVGMKQSGVWCSSYFPNISNTTKPENHASKILAREIFYATVWWFKKCHHFKIIQEHFFHN